jgi:diguanylate cyclase (GGDEF)-like protein
MYGKSEKMKVPQFLHLFLLIFTGVFLILPVFLKWASISLVAPVLFLIIVLFTALHFSRRITYFSIIVVSLLSLINEFRTPSVNSLMTWGLYSFAFVCVGLEVSFEMEKMRKIQYYHEERSAILNIADSLTNTLDLRELMDSIVNQIIELFSAYGCTVYLLDEEAKELKPMACREFEDNVEIIEQLMKSKVRVGFGLVGWIAATGESLFSGDAERDPRAVHVPGTPNDDESVIGIPLQRDRHVFGVLWIYKLGLNAFDMDDFQLAHIFANQVSVALANAQLYENVRRLSETDSLTGLLNSRSLSEVARHVISKAASTGDSASLLFIDCDNFKGINDLFGHPVGDEFLCFLAKLLKTAVREEDIVIRYAGDEFVIILPNTVLNEAKIVAERIMVDIRNHHMGNIPYLNTTVSIGLAVYPDHAHCAEELIKFADDALYQVKRNGKDQLAIFGEGIVTTG